MLTGLCLTKILKSQPKTKILEKKNSQKVTKILKSQPWYFFHTKPLCRGLVMIVFLLDDFFYCFLLFFYCFQIVLKLDGLLKPLCRGLVRIGWFFSCFLCFFHCFFFVFKLDCFS